jgi:3-oxoacyl-[acyl-carrier protein] reductase
MASAFDFSGKVALVTGSSRGIGAGIVTALGQHGARCIINYVGDRDGRNKAEAKALSDKHPDSILVQCDVSDWQQVNGMKGYVQDQAGGIDFLINNAGILRDKTIRKMAIDEWKSVLDVNLSGPFHCIKMLGDIIRPEGRIVNMASVAALAGFFGQANYAASKAGLIALTKVAARELARSKITVNAIAPGFIDTEMTRGMPEDVTQKFIEQIPLGRFGTVDDIVGATMWLCSEHARYVTGQVIHVNGGFYMP